MKEAWTLEVILPINLKFYKYSGRKIVPNVYQKMFLNHFSGCVVLCVVLLRFAIIQ